MDTPDRYEVGEEIGKGGMGIVYRAQDKKLGRQVALKRIHSNLAKDPLAIGRLQKEATLAATLEHPNIVRVYDVIRDDQGAFITMEHVAGQSLADQLEHYGSMRPYLAMSLCRQVGKALAFAHAKGVVHLDVKPSNILMAPNGEPKLADFGIANWTQEQGDFTRELLGSPEYAAPELSKPASKPDARADVYSLAATLYTLLTGESPRLVRESGIPKPFQSLLLKSLSEDPARRPASMEAFLQELESINPNQRSLMPVVIGLVSLFLVIGLVAYLLYQTDAEPAAESVSDPVVPGKKTVPRQTVTPAKTEGSIAPEPEPRAELEALNVITTGKHTWAYGFVKNTGSIPIEKPRVDLSLFDEKDSDAGGGFSYAAFELLEPGMRAPLSMVVKGYKGKHARYQAKVGARKLYSRKRRLAKLSIHDQKLTKGDYGRMTFYARIRNDDSLLVKFAQAVVVFYDKQDRVIGVSTGYAKNKELLPGKDTPVEVGVYSPSRQAPTRYEAFASGAVYEK